LYGLNTGIIYDSGADDVYNNLYDDFMKNEVSRVEYLLSKNVPVLVYNGQDDLIVQSAGTMKWVDKLRYANIEEFKSSLFTAWKINGKIVGSIKSAGLLEFRIVNNAGHLVPMDCP
jgi:carboxypeptidase C (cathepsin A)